jgi:NAD(P)-dependent dehydrogenase (short-subunit alcohol dehydrogenase family)
VKILVTGGAGYIGSTVAAQLVEGGHQVTVFDNLSSGHAGAVPAGAEFVLGEILDREALGKLLDASHASLRDDFEVSSPALDAIVSCAQAHPACFGSRMTGAGFGGCAVALVEADKADDFVTKASASYTAETGLQPQVYVCRASDGARVVSGS